VHAFTAVDQGAIDFHGVPITLSYEPFARDAFRPLFAGFERLPHAEHGLHVELRSSRRILNETPPLDWRPTFCHGLVQGYTLDGAHVLSDGQSKLEVFPRLGRMFGEVFEGAETDLSAGMQHIALSLLLRERGIFDLHAATACTESRALVLIGDSGAGKTTLLLSLMELGCDFLGDDRLLFRVRSNGTELLAYPREFHLSPATLELVSRPIERLPGTQPIAGKFSVEPLKVWPERFRRSWVGPISLVLPQIEDCPTSSLRRVSAAEAFGKLLSSSATVVVEAIESRAEQMRALKALADRADAYEVTLGSDLLSQPVETARRLLASLESLAREP
jgi:lambda repressor-like predicted transcriptional regulator